MIGSALSHYRILDKLGTGGMGEVYLALDTRLDRNVALKLLPASAAADPRSRERFEREARLVASLNHPNIVTIYSVEAVEARRFLIMELVDGESLERRLRRPSRLSLEEIFDLAIPLADAVAAAHAKGVTHRDLKPSNVMVTREGRVKVLDFGLAKLLEPPTPGSATQLATLEDDSLTAAGTILGTYPYMSPEQVEGKPLDHRTDIFSLGVVLFEMATGRRPFEGKTSAALTAAILKDEPQSVTELNTALPGHLGRIIRRCLEKDPEHRLQSALDLRNELEALRRELQTESLRSTSTPAPAAPTEKPSRLGRILPWVVFSTLVLIALAGARWWLGRETPSRAATGVRQTAVAVLPFQNLTDDGTIDYLELAVPDEITTTLSRASELSIRPFSMTSSYGPGEVEANAAGDRLGASSVVTGQYYREVDQLVLTLEAIEVEGNKVLWRDRVSVPADDLLSLRSQIVERVREQLLPRLGATEVGDETLPTNREAYDLYMRSLALDEGPVGNRTAVEMLEESLELDPEYAPAWAELASRQNRIGNYNLADLEQANALYDEAERNAREALRLDPELVTATQRLIVLKTDRGELAEAYDLAEELVERRPDSAHAHFAKSYVLRYAGLLDEAMRECEIARSIDPTSRTWRSCSIAFNLAGRYEKAQEYLELDLGTEWIRDNAFTLALREGEPESALAIIELGIMTPAYRRYFVACTSGAPPEEVESLARETYDVYVTLVDAEQSAWVAPIMAYCGQHEMALELLRRGVELGYCSVPALDIDPLLDSIRGLPEFAEIRQAGIACQQRFLAHRGG